LGSVSPVEYLANELEKAGECSGGECQTQANDLYVSRNQDRAGPARRDTAYFVASEDDSAATRVETLRQFLGEDYVSQLEHADPQRWSQLAEQVGTSSGLIWITAAAARRISPTCPISSPKWAA